MAGLILRTQSIAKTSRMVVIGLTISLLLSACSGPSVTGENADRGVAEAEPVDAVSVAPLDRSSESFFCGIVQTADRASGLECATRVVDGRDEIVIGDRIVGRVQRAVLGQRYGLSQDAGLLKARPTQDDYFNNASAFWLLENASGNICADVEYRAADTTSNSVLIAHGGSTTPEPVGFAITKDQPGTHTHEFSTVGSATMPVALLPREPMTEVKSVTFQRCES